MVQHKHHVYNVIRFLHIRIIFINGSDPIDPSLSNVNFKITDVDCGIVLASKISSSFWDVYFTHTFPVLHL